MQSKHKYILIGVAGIVVGVLFTSAAIVLAGNLDPSNPPGSTSSYSLEDIYDRLDAGTAGSQSTFTEPGAGPGSTMHTLNDIMGKAPTADNTNGATIAEVLTGKTYWSLRTSGGTWGPQTGTAAAGSDVSGPDGSKTFSIPDGFYSSKSATANDSDLLAGNIRQGVNIFGVDGTLSGGSTYNAGVPKTGQTTKHADGDDGDLEKGVAWPSPRFTDNSDGTVTDNLTGLVWLKNANCPNGRKNWNDALTFANSLYDGWTGDPGGGDCGLSDGSSAGDWRLPNVRELHSLIDFSQYGPALPSGHLFTGVQSYYCWSSTTYAGGTSYAWVMYLSNGYVYYEYKTSTHHVWPVRGGQ